MGLWPAVEEFLAEHPSEWALQHRYTNNNGLTVLKRVLLESENSKCFSELSLGDIIKTSDEEILPSIMRVAYNRIPKTGSSYMIAMLTALSKKNGFHVENHQNYYPSKEALKHDLHALRNNTVYVNHAGFLPSEGDLVWINVVREPIERWASVYYYAVDPGLRGEAANELARRENDTECGCARLEFDECINFLYHRNCSIVVPSQISNFCEPGFGAVDRKDQDEYCGRELATTRVHKNYLLVGLTKELELTTQLLEILLPGVFRGATALPHVSHRATSLTNGLTGTSLNGAISTRSRKQIAEKAVNYKDELLFYKDVKRFFFRQACKHGALAAPPENSPTAE